MSLNIVLFVDKNTSHLFISVSTNMYIYFNLLIYLNSIIHTFAITTHNITNKLLNLIINKLSTSIKSK